MTHGRKARRPRITYVDTMLVARNQATRLTTAEVERLLDPARNAERALREGVASQWQWELIDCAMHVAQEIERQGVVRGLCGHLHNARTALEDVHRRATSAGAWRSTPLSLQELEHIGTAVDLYAFQIRHLSYGEYRRAVDRIAAQNRNTGGQPSPVADNYPVQAGASTWLATNPRAPSKAS